MSLHCLFYVSDVCPRCQQVVALELELLKRPSQRRTAISGPLTISKRLLSMSSKVFLKDKTKGSMPSKRCCDKDLRQWRGPYRELSAVRAA